MKTRIVLYIYLGQLIDKIHFGEVEFDCLTGMQIDEIDYR